jgi:hypothetical protein
MTETLSERIGGARRMVTSDLKRPDFFVRIRGVGLLGFDVKAKTVYRGQNLLRR